MTNHHIKNSHTPKMSHRIIDRIWSQDVSRETGSVNVSFFHQGEATAWNTI